MKTDISIPNPIFRAAEDLAKKMGISLSELYLTALTTYIMEHQKENITDVLNRVLETEPSTVEPEMVKMLVLSIGGEEW